MSFTVRVLTLLCVAIFFCGCGGGGKGGGSTPPPPSAAHEWTWISGADADTPWDNSDPVYGTQGVASANNVPGGRNSAASWTDGDGDFWLFGGISIDANDYVGILNDLWEFDPDTGEWTWVGGSDIAGTTDSSPYGSGPPGVYGVLGTPSPSNVPGARLNAVSWIDGAGDLWLFGGQAFDSAGNFGYMNDLWSFNLASKQWTWVSGSNTLQGAQTAVYGTQGTAAPANVPLGLTGATGWIDNAGNLWLFGGSNIVAFGVEAFGIYNNLWEFTPTTGEWTWVRGGGANYNQPANYGSIGVPSASNDPGAREGALGWIDHTGNLWLFGGDNGNEVGPSVLNDLWTFNTTTGEWTWINGSNAPAAGTPGQYGTKGVAAASNVPGGRYGAVGWIDPSGKLWLFGGYGNDSSSSAGGTQLNDLWEFDPSSDEWTWINGPSVGNGGGTYGTKGAPSPSNVPGSRYYASSWSDRNGNLWIFGGSGCADNSIDCGSTVLNDLWRYDPH